MSETLQKQVERYVGATIIGSQGFQHVVYCCVNGFSLFLALKEMLSEVNSPEAKNLEKMAEGSYLAAQLTVAIHAEREDIVEGLVKMVKDYFPVGLCASDEILSNNETPEEIQDHIKRGSNPRTILYDFIKLLHSEREFIANQIIGDTQIEYGTDDVLFNDRFGELFRIYEPKGLKKITDYLTEINPEYMIEIGTEGLLDLPCYKLVKV